jgi:hypothetical protein
MTHTTPAQRIAEAEYERATAEAKIAAGGFLWLLAVAAACLIVAAVL